MTDVATLRDDMLVTAAILRRLDNGQRDMLAEMRALHDIQQRWVERVRKLEDAREGQS